MKIKVSGVVRKRVKKKSLPFTKDRWESFPFEWEHDLSSGRDSGSQVMDDLGLSVVTEGDTISVYARLKSQRFLLSNGGLNQPKRVPFTVLSVGGIEMSGNLTHEPAA